MSIEATKSKYWVSNEGIVYHLVGTWQHKYTILSNRLKWTLKLRQVNQEEREVSIACWIKSAGAQKNIYISCKEVLFKSDRKIFKSIDYVTIYSLNIMCAHQTNAYAIENRGKKSDICTHIFIRSFQTAHWSVALLLIIIIMNCFVRLH